MLSLRAMADSTSTRIPTALNLTLAVLIACANLSALLVAPIFHAIPCCAIAFATLAALASPTHWALIHEAIHGLLLPGRSRNAHLARVLAILFGVPFRAVRFAHLRHHRYNRSVAGREEVYDPATRSRAAAFAMHYLRITCGLYVGELALSLLCWLPRSVLRRRLEKLCPDLRDGSGSMIAVAEREVLSASALAQIRIDGLAVIALYGTAFALYGARWPILVAMLGVRALLASQLDHAPHHGTPLDRREHALNLAAPRWLRAVLLNFNFHRAHHEHPHLPWRALPARATHEPGDISFAHGVLRQWRGPIALPRAAAVER
ncbi:MAG: fatty acid desaturase [Rhodanobacteraceae bacterium]